MINIRTETLADIEAIRAVNDAAFETSAEATLVDALREADAHIVSLVAEEAGRVVGHILFSPVTISSDTDIVQAVGRVIRKAPDKTIGTVVLPVFIDAQHSLQHRQRISDHGTAISLQQQ